MDVKFDYWKIALFIQLPLRWISHSENLQLLLAEKPLNCYCTMAKHF